MTSIDVSIAPSERKVIFREFMAAFNPAATAEQSIVEGLLDTQSANLYVNLAGRADVEPGSLQVVLGGIGTGKTTQLMLAAGSLRHHGANALYAEVSQFTDLSEAGPGILAAIFAVLLNRPPNQIPVKTRRELNEFAHGRWVGPEPPEYESDFGEVFVRGRLKEPIPYSVRQVEMFESVLVEAMRVTKAGTVLLFDGLDRIEDPATFWNTVGSDLALFRRLGISVIIVAPWALAFRADEKLRQVFDRVHELRVERAEIREAAMLKVLAIRDKHKLFHEAATLQLGDFSGGITRDLIMLARDAGEEAYLQGDVMIDLSHVAVAIRNLGKSYSIGLDPAQLKRLKRIGTGTADFSPSDPADLALLLSSRVLQKTPTTYRVHPALGAVL